MTWGQRLIRIAEQAMEELARREFSVQRILELAYEAAAQGYWHVSIEPSRPVDLRQTETFKATAAQLVKHRLKLDWNIRYDRSGRNAYPVLTISWEHADSPGMPFSYRR